LQNKKKLNNIQKRDKYAKFVKEMHWPQISKTKQQEMEALKSSINFHKPLNRSTQSQDIKKRISTNRSENRLSRNNDYVSSSIPSFTGLKQVTRQINSSHSIIKRSTKKKWKENPLLPKPVPKKEPKIIDYLQIRRQKREVQEKSDDGKRSRYKNPYLDYKNIATDRTGNRSANNFSLLANYGLGEKSTIEPSNDKNAKIEKLGKIREKARMIEETVNRKEQLMKVQGGSINDSVSVNDLLINAIEAKLRILEDL